MWPSEITVKQHLKEIQQAAEMRQMAAEARLARRAAQPSRINRLLAPVLLLFRRPHQTDVVEWSGVSRAKLQAAPVCSPSARRST